MRRSLIAFVVLCVATTGVVLAVDREKQIFPTIPDVDNIRFRSVETKTGPMVEVRVGKVAFLSPKITFLGNGHVHSELRAVKDGVKWSGDRGAVTAAQLEFSTRLGLPGGRALGRK